MFVAVAQFGFPAQFFLFGFGVGDVALGHGGCVLLHSFGRQSEVAALFAAADGLRRGRPRQPVQFRNLKGAIERGK